ncbi:MAG: hypothetical protein AB7T06_07020 [Kofleriaceae bacterium]
MLKHVRLSERRSQLRRVLQQRDAALELVHNEHLGVESMLAPPRVDPAQLLRGSIDDND